MATSPMQRTLTALMTPGRGILAADESNTTVARRFAEYGIAPTEENRRRYRQLFFTTPGWQRYISGVILFDETLRQRADDGRLFVAILIAEGIIPGIKVDLGATRLAGEADERITEGLDGLRERLREYRTLGARFAKWRAVLAIGDGLPSTNCVDTNAHALARYAALCQEAGLVPIVEPEILADGTHSLERCSEATERLLESVFRALRTQGVVLEQMLLKPNMVLPGTESPQQVSVRDVAEATVSCLRRVVPGAVPGIVFLSGGQEPQRATAHLNAMNAMPAPHQWPLSFSFARALQAPALAAWQGKTDNVPAAQRAFEHRAHCNSAASVGRYSTELESGSSTRSIGE